jgi:CheY-like chemotaxis protein
MQPVRVLVADDDDECRKALVDCISGEPGFSTMEAESGTEALEVARASKPDVLLLDQRMPGLSGADVVRALRADGADVGLVLISASRDVGTIADELAVPHLSKPFSLEELFASIRRAATGCTRLRSGAV